MSVVTSRRPAVSAGRLLAAIALSMTAVVVGAGSPAITAERYPVRVAGCCL